MIEWHMGQTEQRTGRSYTVEGFEDRWAVLEKDGETTFPVPRAWLLSGTAKDEARSFLRRREDRKTTCAGSTLAGTA